MHTHAASGVFQGRPETGLPRVLGGIMADGGMAGGPAAAPCLSPAAAAAAAAASCAAVFAAASGGGGDAAAARRDFRDLATMARAKRGFCCCELPNHMPTTSSPPLSTNRGCAGVRRTSGHGCGAGAEPSRGRGGAARPHLPPAAPQRGLHGEFAGSCCHWCSSRSSRSVCSRPLRVLLPTNPPCSAPQYTETFKEESPQAADVGWYLARHIPPGSPEEVLPAGHNHSIRHFGFQVGRVRRCRGGRC